MAFSNISPQPYNQHALLRVYTYYRTVLAILLLAMFYLSGSSAISLFSARHTLLFNIVSHAYAFVAIISAIRLYRQHFQLADQYVFLICFVDVICVTLLMHASGGIDQGLGLLLLIIVSAASILLNAQLAFLVAALSTLGVLTSVGSEVLYRNNQMDNLLPAGLLGFLFFASSQLFIYLTRRIKLSTEETELQTRHREEAQQLNELIVRRMRTGLIVLTPNGRIRLMNESAAKLLDMPLFVDKRIVDKNVSEIDISFADIPALYECWQEWLKSPHIRPNSLRLRKNGPELQLSFAGLDQAGGTDSLVFVEDAREITQQAQQLKLVSLGHLTANIAHEVRNPLGAISHAAQLLAESSTIDPNDLRLSEIIQTHSLRVNQIIENVLQLSKRKTPQPKHINVQNCLQDFVHRYQQSHRDNSSIDIQCDTPDTVIYVDSSQLEQVLNNLCDNGLRHSKQSTGKAHVVLHCHLDESLNTPCLDIIDDGNGISEEHVSKIFDPFFTTETQGTGLGLYMCQEICTANQAQLTYHQTDEGKSCFQISFSHPDKSIAKPTAS